MIKQARWENAAGLHNADEALFLDNPRPRDSEWFKIQHWLNTPKQDWRTANKNTFLKEKMFRWLGIIPPSTIWKDINWGLIEFKEKWDKESVNSYMWTTYTYLTQKQMLEALNEKSNLSLAPSVSIKDWNLYFWEDWTYLIQYNTQIMYQNQGSVSSPSYKECASLFNYEWTALHRNIIWSVNYPWEPWSVYVSSIKKGEIIALWCYHTKSNNNALALWNVLVVQLC